MSLLIPTLALASRIASTRHGAIDDHDGYDWRRSTSENHRNPAAPLRHEFAASRARLDYSWHVHYSLRRQEQQDAIIRRMLRDGAVGGAEWLRDDDDRAGGGEAACHMGKGKLRRKGASIAGQEQ